MRSHHYHYNLLNFQIVDCDMGMGSLVMCEAVDGRGLAFELEIVFQHNV